MAKEYKQKGGSKDEKKAPPKQPRGHPTDKAGFGLTYNDPRFNPKGKTVVNNPGNPPKGGNFGKSERKRQNAFRRETRERGGSTEAWRSPPKAHFSIKEKKPQ